MRRMHKQKKEKKLGKEPRKRLPAKVIKKVKRTQNQNKRKIKDKRVEEED